MSTNNQSEWPKSFRWHADFNGQHDIVTFTWEHDIDTDATGVIWAYRDCHDISVWKPTDQHKQKTPPAPSQDDVKAEVALQVSNARAKLRQCDRAGDDAIDEKVRSLNCAIDWLADAVERLAK